MIREEILGECEPVMREIVQEVSAEMEYIREQERRGSKGDSLFSPLEEGLSRRGLDLRRDTSLSKNLTPQRRSFIPQQFQGDQVLVEDFPMGSKSRVGMQPRQADITYLRPSVTGGVLRKESKMRRILNSDAYFGNKWGIILGSDEYWILWWVFRQVAFLVDRARGV
jgi:hypothetical protein